jgi:hypothetical protein
MELVDADGVAWEFAHPTDPWPFLADDVGYRDAEVFEATISVRHGVLQRWDALRREGLVLRRLELVDLHVR